MKQLFDSRFKRPVGLASFTDGEIACLCAFSNQLLWLISLGSNGTHHVTLRTVKGRGISQIRSCSHNRIIGLSECKKYIVAIDRKDMSCKDIHIAESGVTFEWISSSCSSSCIYVGLRVNSTGREYVQVLKEKQNGILFELERIRPPLRAVSDALELEGGGLLIASEKESEVAVWNPGRNELITIAKRGRDGFGYTRSPKSLFKWKGYYGFIDQDNYLIQLFNQVGNYLSQIGGKGTSRDRFDMPQSCIVCDDQLVIADMNNDRIVTLSEEQSLAFKASVVLSRVFSPGVLSRPISGVAIDELVYICDRDNDAIQVFFAREAWGKPERRFACIYQV